MRTDKGEDLPALCTQTQCICVSAGLLEMARAALSAILRSLPRASSKLASTSNHFASSHAPHKDESIPLDRTPHGHQHSEGIPGPMNGARSPSAPARGVTKPQTTHVESPWCPGCLGSQPSQPSASDLCSATLGAFSSLPKETFLSLSTFFRASQFRALAHSPQVSASKK